MKVKDIKSTINIIVQFIKFRIPSKIKYLNGSNSIGKYQHLWGVKKVVVINTPSYNEKGKEKQTKKYLERFYRDFKVIWSDIDNIYSDIKAIEDVLGQEDMIILTEGNLVSNRTCCEEWTKKFIFHKFKNYTIEIIPKKVMNNKKAVI